MSSSNGADHEDGLREPYAGDPAPATTDIVGANRTTPKPKSNLAMRLLTAAVAAPLLILLIFEGPPWGVGALLFFTAAVAGYELMTMTIPEDVVLRVWGVIGTLGIYTAILSRQGSSELTAVLLGLVLSSLLMALVRAKRKPPAGGAIGWLIAGPVYVGGLLAALARLHQFPSGGGWVMVTLMLAWFGDTVAYFAGRAFGKHKLYESVSPTKTVEGAIGGLLGSLLGAMLAHFWYLPELPLWHGVALAFVAGGLGQLGDLCESLVKRSTGVKDSGKIVPGHGGVLDRVDALMFSAGATWMYAEWFHG